MPLNADPKLFELNPRYGGLAIVVFMALRTGRSIKQDDDNHNNDHDCNIDDSRLTVAAATTSLLKTTGALRIRLQITLNAQP